MNSWTAGAYLTALRDLLRLRAGLSDVVVNSAPFAPSQMEGLTEALALVSVITDEEPAALGANRTEEVYKVEGVISVWKDGADEDVAVETRDRAIAIMAEVEAQVRATPDAGLGNANLRHSYVSKKNLFQGLQDQRRRVIVEFDVTITTRIGS